MSINNIDLLLIKSDNNREIARIAEARNFYDVSISRYYYAVYQMMCYLVFHENPNYSASTKGNGSHNDFFKDFRATTKKYEHKLNRHEKKAVKEFWNLKKFRTDADYSTTQTDGQKFSDFWKLFSNFENAVGKIKKEVDSGAGNP